jgi:WD40 repeat protein
LNADHHSICKFETREDPNYISVKNILKHWSSRVEKPSRPEIKSQRCISNAEIRNLRTDLGIRESPETDLNILWNTVLEGTCLWITARRDYISWVNASECKNPNIFWLVGLPATGKTSLARSVIDHLQLRGHQCFYHFFSAGHQVKRTSVYCLRSLAFQIAQVNEDFREQLLAFIEESGTDFNSQTFGLVWEKVFEGILFKLPIRKPIFLVLDGIDEADSQSLLVTQMMKIQSTIPFKLFFTSRPIKIPSIQEGSLSSLTTCFLREEDTHNDISAYIQNIVRTALPGDLEFQDDIIDQVMTKASGSFLWVKLALDTLQDNWHTKEDIRKVLTEVPKGMESLYKQMLEMVKAQSPRLQLMAKRILTWTICCWRPLSVAELQVALEPEFQGFVRLEQTIVQICGHFISVDSSKISLVHATARSFLLHGIDNESPFIDPREGHEHLAIVSLKHLSSNHWRLVLKNVELSSSKFESRARPNRLSIAEKNHPLLGYATCHWAYHVSRSSAGARELVIILKLFLEKYALSWIEGIALSNNLRYLTRSAQYLKSYAKKRLRGSHVDTEEMLLSLRAPPKDETNLQLWANDFIHIVGKFGRNLVQSPSSIHTLVPPLCPQTSMVRKMYGLPDERFLSIAGLASEGWGDCLASVTVGNDEIVSKVLATESYFLTLISTTGTVVVWHAEVCEEARRVHHGEYVSMMALNRSGTRLVTAGFSTFRIWDVSTGKEMYCLLKVSQGLTMAIAFGSTDSQLLVGLDDCSVTHYDLSNSSTMSRFEAREFLQGNQGCPTLMDISPDLQKVAIAWRGKPLCIWDMIESLPPHKCRVSGSSDPLNAPELVKWQADGNSILILCQSSKLVEWNLYNEKLTEYDQYHDTAAREMTVSSDGNFLLTSDNAGTMSVWTFPRLQLIYRLLNGHEFIRDLAFSPNGQRFYDIRESICNVWEPDALVRPDDKDLEDTSSVAESYAATEPIISHDESSLKHVTAFVMGPDDRYYACGKDDGSVVIYCSTEGKKLRKVCSHSTTSSVISMTWSQSGKYIVSSDDSGRIISKRLEMKDRDKWAVFPGMDLRIGEIVQQFVFSDDEKLLLISTPSKNIVWNLKVKKELCSKRHQLGDRGRWVADHMSPGMLLWISCDRVSSYHWDTLESSEIDPSPPLNILKTGNDSEARIREIVLSTDKRSLIYETLHTPSTNGPCLSILSTSSLSHSWQVDLTSQVKRLIGTFQNSLVFLDHDYWICTWELEANSSDVKRHFFLPRDWLNTSTLQMATINHQGTFFCPKFGNVIIVRNGLKM